MGNFLRRFWTPILHSSELPAPDCDPVKVRMLGEDLVAFRDTAGRIGLIQARCPHRLAPLFYGRNENNGLRCIYHGWKFDASGTCVDMPSEPSEFNFADKVRATAYPTLEQQGMVWAYMGPPQLRPQLPDLEYLRVPADCCYHVKYNQECNFVQAIEGDIDSSHIGFLHVDNFPALKAPRTPQEEYRARVAGSAPRWLIEPTDYGLMLAARRDDGPDRFYWRINQWLYPFFTLIAGPIDQSRGHGHIWVPVDDEHTEVWCVIWSPKEPLTEQEKYNILSGPNPHIASLDPATGKLRATAANNFLQDRTLQRTTSYTGIIGTREQDTAVVEGMGAVVDRTIEHLGSSDTAIIGMRRQLLAGAKSLLRGVEPLAPAHPELYRVRGWTAIMKRNEETFLEDPEVKQLMTTLVP
jgi:phenylpropionate dioxygenase-like ring-hydroxylating dioxygenase large terminal subunit